MQTIIMTGDYFTQLIILTGLIIFLPLITMGLVSMWREHRDKKLAEQ